MNAKTFEKLFDYISYNHFYKYSQAEMFEAEEYLKSKNGDEQIVTELEAVMWLEERRRMKFQKFFNTIDWDSRHVHYFLDLLLYNKDDFKRGQ